MTLSVPPEVVGKRLRCSYCKTGIDGATAVTVDPAAPFYHPPQGTALDFDLFPEDSAPGNASSTSAVAGSVLASSWQDSSGDDTAADPIVDVPVVCRLCGSRYYATGRQIGQELRCPDCHTPNVVKKPPPTLQGAAGVAPQWAPGTGYGSSGPATTSTAVTTQGRDGLVDPMMESVARQAPSPVPTDDEGGFRLEAPSERLPADHFLLHTRPSQLPTSSPPPATGFPASAGSAPAQGDRSSPKPPETSRTLPSLPFPEGWPPATPTAPVAPEPARSPAKDPYDLAELAERLPSTGQSGYVPSPALSTAPAAPAGEGIVFVERSTSATSPVAVEQPARGMRTIDSPATGAPAAHGRFKADEVGEIELPIDFSWLPGGLLVEQVVIARLVAVILAMGVAFTIAGYAESSSVDNPVAPFTRLIWDAVAGIIWAVAALLLASICFTICESEANGETKLPDWPHTGFVDPVQHAFFIGATVFLAGVPGALIFSALSAAGFSDYFILLIWPCLWLFFPIIYLSILESGTIAWPFGRTVFASLTRRPRRWIALYIDSVVSMAIMTGAVYAAFYFGWTLGYFAAGVVVACVPVLYFQRLGRLALSLTALRDAMEDDHETESSPVQRPSY